MDLFNINLLSNITIINILIITYFLPLILKLLDVNNNIFKKVLSNEYLILIISLLVTFFLIINNLWVNQYIPIFYFLTFSIIYFFCLKNLNNYTKLIISICSIYIISFIWEIPLLIKEYLIPSYDLLIRNYILLPIKLLSFPILIYYVKKLKNKSYFIYLINIIPFVIIYSIIYLINEFSYTIEQGIIIRILTALLIISANLTFYFQQDKYKKSNKKSKPKLKLYQVKKE